MGGDSAGGNLAAVMALMARDGDLPPLAFQLLVYPATDMGMTHESYQRVTDGVPLTAKTMDWFIDHYLHGPKDRSGLACLAAARGRSVRHGAGPGADREL